jgi:hypothetical protein
VRLAGFGLVKNRPPEYSVRAAMALGTQRSVLVSADEPYCLIHLVPFDHSIE